MKAVLSNPHRLSAVLCFMLVAFFSDGLCLTISITGAVSDHQGAGIAGAAVSLHNNPAITGITDANGVYMLTGQIGVVSKNRNAVSRGGIAVQGNWIVINLGTRARQVAMVIYAINGKRLKEVRQSDLGPGAYSFQLFDKNGSAAYVIVADIDGQQTVVRNVVVWQGDARTGKKRSGKDRLKKAASVPGGVDSVIVSKAGFERAARPAQAAVDTVDFTVVPSPLAFSFATVALPARTTLGASHTTVSRYGINPLVSVSANSDNSFDIAVFLSQSSQIGFLFFDAAGRNSGQLIPEAL
ncbi:MAG: carboxypeptidase regulatory-like domain-containing protein, partial [Chitinispirillaceae bacterium]|nr:carboxypeptidase regulatory-like domain-containing protein [Chitinispirillaceae bacterium]